MALKQSAFLGDEQSENEFDMELEEGEEKAQFSEDDIAKLISAVTEQAQGNIDWEQISKEIFGGKFTSK